MLITKEEARKFILSYQGLLSPRQLEGKEAIYIYRNGRSINRGL